MHDEHGTTSNFELLTHTLRYMNRLFEAECPPLGTPLSVPIACTRVTPRLDRSAQLCVRAGATLSSGAPFTRPVDAVVVVRELSGGRARVLAFVTPANVDAEQLLRAVVAAAADADLHEYVCKEPCLTRVLPEYFTVASFIRFIISVLANVGSHNDEVFTRTFAKSHARVA